MSESEIHSEKLFGQLIVIEGIMCVVDITKLLAVIDIYVWLLAQRSSPWVSWSIIFWYVQVPDILVAKDDFGLWFSAQMDEEAFTGSDSRSEQTLSFTNKFSGPHVVGLCSRSW